MHSACVRHTDLPSPTRLFADFLYDYPKVAPYYGYAPHELDSYRDAARQVVFSGEQRAALVRALTPHNQGSESLRMLARPGTLAVVTGQQAGLFSGPAYTVYKALTAARLARRLTESGLPSVPVFWLATEDHDFAEVDHCWTFDAEHRPSRLQVPPLDSGGRPVGEVPIVASPVDELHRSMAGLPFSDEIRTLVAGAYQPGVTFGEAFRRLLASLLSGYDLLFVDPMLPEMRRLAAPTIASALHQAPELTRAVLARTRELTQLGYHGQVHVEEDTSFVFLLENGRRLTLRRSGREYRRNNHVYSTEELAGRAERLSPNALLRPVIQDAMLPTVAYIGGPAELAYLAQSEVLYRAILGRMPVSVNRSSFTLLDARSEKLLNRYGLTLGDFFHGEETLREKMARRLTPPSLAEAIRETRTDVDRALERFREAVAGFDVSLTAAFEKSRRKIAYQLEKTERKLAREAMHRSARAEADAAYLFNLLYPHKHLQERIYSILPFLARHGRGLLDQLYDNLRLECPDHQLVVV
ncbi:MAG: bacillithiol biosynthesis cysteine-adding enzyme BshC [Bryobacterales bacterium]|nr:bacillithiol biosynthesis cysteine-adding enzyme BshC [Bryobacterales bacterium]